MFLINLKMPLIGKKMHVEVILLHRIKKVQYVVLRKSCFKIYDGYCAYNYCNYGLALLICHSFLGAFRIGIISGAVSCCIR